MLRRNGTWIPFVLGFALMALPSCEKQETAPKAAPASKKAEPPAETAKPDPHAGHDHAAEPDPHAASDPHAGHDHAPGAHPAAAPAATDRANAGSPVGPGGAPLSLTGVAFTVPEGWVPEPAAPGAMGPKAVYKLPQAQGDTGGATVRITHFPGMKGMDDMNIDRWLGQVKHPDGKSFTLEQAKITKHNAGAVQITVVDLDGSVSTDMPGQGGGAAGQRMIAAVVNHPKGPHFVKAIGPAASIGESAEAIVKFIRSAKVTD